MTKRQIMSIPQTPHVLSTLVIVSAIAFVLLATTAGRSAGVPAPAAGDPGSSADQASRTRRSSELAAYGPGLRPGLRPGLGLRPWLRLGYSHPDSGRSASEILPGLRPELRSGPWLRFGLRTGYELGSRLGLRPLRADLWPESESGLRPGRSSELAGYGEGEPVESGLDKRIGRLASWGKKNDMSWLDRAASKAIRSKWSNRNMAVWGKRADDNKRVKWSGNTLAAWG